MAPSRMKIEPLRKEMAVQPRSTKIVQDHLHDFCQSTSLHGVKYLGERHRSRVERLLWLVALLLSIGVCGWLIQQVIVKWETAPVLMTSEMTSTPVWTVPFPAITICSQIKSSRDIFNFTAATQDQENLSSEMKRHLHDMCLVCSIEKCHQNINFNASEESITFLKQAAPPVQNIMLINVWLLKQTFYGQEMFTPILTEEGMCYTFNMLNVQELLTKEAVQSDHHYLNSTVQPISEWTQEEGYSTDAGIDTYPQRGIIGPSDKRGLSVMLITYKKDMDYLCTEADQGFKVYIHNPAELPQARHHQVINVDLNKKVELSVRPERTKTSDLLKSYTPKQRTCFFPPERSLLFFQVYTKANCEMECLANYTLSDCGCVPYYMPRSKNMTICNLRSRQNCVKDYPIAKELSAFKEKYLVKKLKTSELDKWVRAQLDKLPEESFECECLPSCNNLKYAVTSMSSRDFDWQEFFQALTDGRKILDTIQKPNDTLTLATLHIQMNDVQYVATQRTELYGRTDFFANCGGLLGLCMGFSVLSLVELIYFSTIGLYSKLRQKKSDESNE